jgi:hypothetical protein
MTSPEGGFYSSEDADSEGVEGKFYVWTPDEVVAVLGKEEGELFCEFFGVTEQGNFEHGKSILHTPRSLEEFAGEKRIEPEALARTINGARKKLLYGREERTRPNRDDKIITSWNALMLTSVAEAANILGRDDYRRVAARCADFLLENLIDGEGRLLRTYKNGKAKLNAYLEDYAYLSEALLAVYEATFELKYFEQARALVDRMTAQFWDDADVGFFFTSSDHEKLITRTKDYFDNAMPSGNSAAAMVLLKLGLLTQEHDYQQRAAGTLRSVRQAMVRYASGFGYMLCALDCYLSESKEIAIVGPTDSHEVRLFIEEIYSRFLPNKVVAAAEPGDEHAVEAIKLLAGRTPVGGQATTYVCRDYICLAPATTPQELADRLAR